MLTNGTASTEEEGQNTMENEAKNSLPKVEGLGKTANSKVGDVVRFTEPTNDAERESRMIVLEDRETRMLVVDCAFVSNLDWPIAPTAVYATADLEVV
jgi:hypothetical protein